MLSGFNKKIPAINNDWMDSMVLTLYILYLSTIIAYIKNKHQNKYLTIFQYKLY